MTNHMRKCTHLYHPIVWYKCKSLRMWFAIYRTTTKFSFLLF